MRRLRQAGHRRGMGGRAAELVVFGEGSTGAADVLTGATQIATRMVREFGVRPARPRRVRRGGPAAILLDYETIDGSIVLQVLKEQGPGQEPRRTDELLRDAGEPN